MFSKMILIQFAKLSILILNQLNVPWGQIGFVHLPFIKTQQLTFVWIFWRWKMKKKSVKISHKIRGAQNYRLRHNIHYLLYLCHFWTFGLLDNAWLNHSHKNNPMCHSSNFHCKTQNCAYMMVQYYPTLCQHKNLDLVFCGCWIL